MDVLGTLKKNFTATRKVAAEKAKIAKEIFMTKEQIRSNKKEIRTLIYKIGQKHLKITSMESKKLKK